MSFFDQLKFGVGRVTQQRVRGIQLIAALIFTLLTFYTLYLAPSAPVKESTSQGFFIPHSVLLLALFLLPYRIIRWGLFLVGLGVAGLSFFIGFGTLLCSYDCSGASDFLTMILVSQVCFLVALILLAFRGKAVVITFSLILIGFLLFVGVFILQAIS